ncbi:Vitamin K-dependent S [Heracleum sosnowskyi]|uniref:Vitamin K-dependent S n=1 Tax=Heracleum sosnowskyi TaxID=360622 RepID=A0AAD8NB69_9APIA|nr:Vitamin K-dependent S [Heracleum sosnowskyi]
MATSTRKTGNNGPVLRSQSPSGRFYSPRSSGSSPFASSSTTFSSHQSTFLHRSVSPTRVNLHGSSTSPSSSVKFSINRPGSPSRSISATSRNQVVKKSGNNPITRQKRTCMCSPTNHPGSFRCSMHKNVANQAPSASYPANRLNARRSAMTNSLVRIGTVEGELVKRALSALIRPSSHSQKRRGSFQPRPSRLSVMSKAEER